MALPIITPDNFTGWVKIVANSFKQEDLQFYINLFLEQYLRLIVGDAAYSDIENQTRQKWDDLVNGVDFVDAEGKRRRQRGFVDSLIYFIYFEYLRDNFNPTQPGQAKPVAENSERASDLETLNVARSRYNKAVELINVSTPDFLEANKKLETEVTTSTDNADNTYTLAVPSTKYLEAGDTIVINGIEYQPISVTADTSIVIDAGQVGLDFTGNTITWEPYKDVEFCPLEFAGI